MKKGNTLAAIKKGSTLTISKKNMLEGYVFILPWLIGIIGFFIFPFFVSMRLSFSKITKITGFEMQWIGLENYIKAFVYDIEFLPIFAKMVKETFLNLPIINIFALFLAILVNRDSKAKGLFRAIYFLPVLLGSGYIMQQLLGMNMDGQSTNLVRGITIPGQVMQYLGPVTGGFLQGFLDRLTVILWRSGVQIILYLGGLQGISSSLYESAKCDGATEWEMFWKITLPMMSPIIMLNIVYTVIESFTDVSNPMVTYLIDVSIKKNKFEYGAAIGWIYFVFIFIIIALVFIVFKNFFNNSVDNRGNRSESYKR